MKLAIKSFHERPLEWFFASVMVAWGGTLALPGDLLSNPAFVAFHRFGLTEAFWAFAFSAMGGGRLVALYINGRWPRGPLIRMAGATFGAVSWAQLSFLFFQAAQINDTAVGTGPAVYALFAIFELYSINRAAFDVRYHNS